VYSFEQYTHVYTILRSGILLIHVVATDLQSYKDRYLESHKQKYI